MRAHVEQADGDPARYPSQFLLAGTMVSAKHPNRSRGERRTAQDAIERLDKSGIAEVFDIAIDIDASSRTMRRPSWLETSASIRQRCNDVRSAREQTGKRRIRRASAGAAALLEATGREHGEKSGERIEAVAGSIADVEAGGAARTIDEEHVQEAIELHGMLAGRST